MCYQNLLQKIVGLILVTLFLSGCSASADTPTSAPPTATAAATSADGIWTARADMPTGRWELSTCVVDGKIYAIGGAGPEWQALGSVEEYDPATDTQTTKSEMPTARQGLSTNVVNGKIYAIGGGVSSSESYGSVETYSTGGEYDPATNSWTTKSEMPTSRGFHSANVVDGKIYVIGGSHSAHPDMNHVKTVVVYDPATDTWTQKSDMPTERHVLSTSVLDGKIYVIGGYVPGVSGYPGVTTVEVYDPETDTWTTAPDMPTAKFGLRTSVVDEKIYVIGGMEYWIGSALGTVEEYDPK